MHKELQLILEKIPCGVMIYDPNLTEIYMANSELNRLISSKFSEDQDSLVDNLQKKCLTYFSFNNPVEEDQSSP